MGWGLGSETSFSPLTPDANVGVPAGHPGWAILRRASRLWELAQGPLSITQALDDFVDTARGAKACKRIERRQGVCQLWLMISIAVITRG